MQISVLSKQYIRVRVIFLRAGLPVAITGDQVEFAFLADGVDPGSSDWKLGSWATGVDQDTGETVYWAQVLVGPGATTTLPKGAYKVWVRITDSPEIPVADVGFLKVA